MYERTISGIIESKGKAMFISLEGRGKEINIREI